MNYYFYPDFTPKPPKGIGVNLSIGDE